MCVIEGCRRGIVFAVGVAGAVSALATALATVAGPLTGLAARLADGSLMDVAPADLVIEASALALVSGACWATLLAVAGVWEATAGGAPRLLRRVTPGSTRRAVALACAVALGHGVSGAPAHALREGPPAPAAVGQELRLRGLPLPERPVTQVSQRDEIATPAALRVRAGDSLWTLAQGLLPARAPDILVDRTWRALYDANRDQIGADPDVIVAGTTLRVPRTLGDRRGTGGPHS